MNIPQQRLFRRKRCLQPGTNQVGGPHPQRNILQEETSLPPGMFPKRNLQVAFQRMKAIRSPLLPGTAPGARHRRVRGFPPIGLPLISRNFLKRPQVAFRETKNQLESLRSRENLLLRRKFRKGFPRQPRSTRSRNLQMRKPRKQVLRVVLVLMSEHLHLARRLQSRKCLLLQRTRHHHQQRSSTKVIGQTPINAPQSEAPLPDLRKPRFPPSFTSLK